MLRTAMISMVLLTAAFPALAGVKSAATLYKYPLCGCCEEYANYLCDNGYTLNIEPTQDLSSIHRQHGVPENLEGCHVMLIDGYVVEGHVPVDILNRLLSEKPAIRGISIPGMPMGSPGMSGPKTEPFTIYTISNGAASVYAVD